MNIDKNKYQLNFSDNYKILFDEKSRLQKANKIIAVLNDFLGQLKNLKLLDVGSSTGLITYHLSKYFFDTIGIDIDEKGVKYAKEHFENEHLHFYVQDSMNIQFPDNSFDVINCTHIYEHVPDSKRLMNEIYRVIKSGGICFFAAGNRFAFIEAHYKLPLLSIVPKWIANRYIRLFGRADFYYEKHLTYWGLKKLVSKFEIIDYTIKIIKKPEQYFATEMVKANSITQYIYLIVLKIAYWICPTYIWILRKK
jgi:ubiquinone/menaquinone biosynthesis C-methylase UbiE